jgi:hypothetical protein
MSEPSIELIVREVITKQRRDGTTTSWVQVATVDPDTIAFHEVPLGGDLKLAAALDDAKLRYTRLPVPATFFEQDNATKLELLQQALASRWG